MLSCACPHVYTHANIGVMVIVTRRLDMDAVFAQAEADDAADALFGIDLQRTRLHALAVTDGYVLDEEDYLS